jgi:hyperosmotically inducible periplasmic protein
MKTLRMLTAAVLLAGLVACDDTAKGLKKDAEDNATAAKGAEPEAKDAAATAKDKAQELGDKAAAAAEKAAPVLDAAKQTADVKAALMADPTVNATDIDVDSDATAKTVTLNGTVPTAAAKTQAETVAKSKAEGWTVVNKLRVAAAAPKTK